MEVKQVSMPSETGYLTLNSSSSLNDTMLPDYFTYCSDYPMGYLFWSGLSMIFFLLGFPVSLMELRELLQKQRASNNFMLSLAIIDVTLTATIPISVINFNVWKKIQIEYVCNLFYSLTLCGRPLFMACTCVDCYFAVVHPIMYMSYQKIAMVRKVVSVGVWLISILFGPLMNSTFLSLSPLVSIPLLIALVVIVFCDISVLQALKKPGPSGTNDIHPKKKQALYTIINSFIMTFIVYLPPTVIFSFAQLIQQMLYYCILLFYAFLFSFSGCIIMPIVYLDSVGKMEFLKKWWRE